MRFSDLISLYGYYPQLCLDPDKGGGTGGTAVADPLEDDDDGDGAPAPEPTYTKADIESAVNKRVRKMTKENSASQARIKELEDKLDALIKAQPPVVDPDDPESKKAQGQFELQRQRYDSQIQDLQGKLRVAEDELKNERTNRQSMQRDVAVTRALEKAGCIDTEVGLKIFNDRAEYDEDEAAWYLKMKTGNLSPIEEGIASELPDYLKPASMRGGSGASGGSTKANATKRKLDAAKEELKSISDKLRKTPSDDMLVTEYRRKSKIVKDLEKQCNAS